MNLDRLDTYPNFTIPDGDMEIAMKVIRTCRDACLSADNFAAKGALLLSEAHAWLFDTIKQLQSAATEQSQPIQAESIQAESIPAGEPVHVLDQTGQPYGSSRLACNRCGIYVSHGMVFTDNLAEWERTSNNCSKKVETAPALSSTFKPSIVANNVSKLPGVTWIGETTPDVHLIARLKHKLALQDALGLHEEILTIIQESCEAVTGQRTEKILAEVERRLSKAPITAEEQAFADAQPTCQVCDPHLPGMERGQATVHHSLCVAGQIEKAGLGFVNDEPAPLLVGTPKNERRIAGLLWVGTGGSGNPTIRTSTSALEVERADVPDLIIALAEGLPLEQLHQVRLRVAEIRPLHTV